MELRNSLIAHHPVYVQTTPSICPDYSKSSECSQPLAVVNFKKFSKCSRYSVWDLDTLLGFPGCAQTWAPLSSFFFICLPLPLPSFFTARLLLPAFPPSHFLLSLLLSPFPPSFPMFPVPAQASRAALFPSSPWAAGAKAVIKLGWEECESKVC